MQGRLDSASAVLADGFGARFSDAMEQDSIRILFKIARIGRLGGRRCERRYPDTEACGRV